MAVQSSEVELLRLTTVLQDCAEQLEVLGNIMPVTYKGRPGTDTVVLEDIGEDIGEAIGEAFARQKGAEQNLQAARLLRVEGLRLGEATRDLHRSQKELSRTLEASPLSPDNLAKVQRDRQFVSQVITDVLKELQDAGTFQSLLLAVEEEKKMKAHLLDVIVKEEESRQKAKALQKQLLDIHKEKTLELQRREEMTAHLKDQLQEMKAKTRLERKYVKSSAELLVYQGHKLNSHKEKVHEDEIKRIQENLEEERRVHREMERFLKEKHTRLTEKLEMWMEQYDRDVEDKQQELDTLKNHKANNLAKLQELVKKYRESEQVVIEDRVQKENLKRQLEKDRMEQAAATKIQSWWRGTMVRRGRGTHKKGTKPKAKEGKKGKKK